MRSWTSSLQKSIFHFGDIQTKWGFLKDEIRTFLIDYLKTDAEIRKQQRINLKQELKTLESNLTSEESRKLYSHYRNKLETIDGHIVDGIGIKNNCEWYEHGEK